MIAIYQSDARKIPLADESVQCIVTSPPYWGLRKYAGEQEVEWADGSRAAFGLEPTLEMYIAHTVEILRECGRVLRRDGALFWNIGDSYSSGNREGHGSRIGYKQETNRGTPKDGWRPPMSEGIKPKDLCLIPSRVAIAAQADGWWVRSMIIWTKPNPMPESCRDRPTDAYEHILMLTKAERYFWDQWAVRESATYGVGEQRDGGNHKSLDCGSRTTAGLHDKTWVASGTRNLRNVWTFATQPFSGAHFATFPEELPRRCILAATSAKGCCAQCGAPWERVTRRSVRFESGSGRAGNPPNGKNGSGYEQAVSGEYDIRMGPVVESQTLGWSPTCRCCGQRGKTVPCVVLDPFGGSGTTGRVAAALGRRAVLVDLAYGEGAYQELAEKRTSEVQQEILF